MTSGPVLSAVINVTAWSVQLPAHALTKTKNLKEKANQINKQNKEEIKKMRMLS